MAIRHDVVDYLVLLEIPVRATARTPLGYVFKLGV